MSKRRFYGRLDARRAMLMAAPFCAIFAAQKAHAVDHNPTNLASLRTAINTCNMSVTNDRIFLPAGTITLDAGALDNANATGDLDITKNIGSLEIIGAGQTTTIIDGNGLDRVFHINAAATVDITDLTIRNGLASDTGTATGTALGGGILYQGTGVLTLFNVTITQNVAQGQAGANGAVAGGNGSSGSPAEGGGLYLAGGGVAITACTISNNTASGGQGGLGAAAFNVAGSGPVLNGNNGGFGGSGALARGGGLYCAAGGTIAINGSTISGNVAAGGSGGDGGLGGNADAFGTGAVIAANGGNGGSGGAGGQPNGGGLYVSSGTISLSECCVNGNSVTGGAGGNGGQGGNGTAAGTATGSSVGAGGRGGHGTSGGVGLGGGFLLASGALTIVNCTVSGNTASSGDGGDGGMGGDGLGGTATSPGSGGNGGQSQLTGGGGMFASGSTLDISNSTLAFNTAVSGNGGQGGAPGPGGTAASSGMDGTASGSFGGGIVNSGATVTIDSSIVSDNAADSNLDIQGAVTADACVIEVLAGASITAGPNGNLTGDPGLSALAFNAGPTRNHRIAETSIARNTGTNPLSRPTDQRGQPRNDGGGVDVGAFEFTAGVDDVGGGGGGGGGGDDGGGCSTVAGTSKFWLFAPLAALLVLLRPRRARQ